MQFHFTFQPDESHPNGGEYIASDNRWKRGEWGDDLANYPDPEHAVFKDDYDWEFRDKKGVLCQYISHIEGNARVQGRKKLTSGHPITYWLFCLGAMHLINKPHLIRKSRQNSLHGGFVVNYVNSIEIESLLPAEENGVVLNDSVIYERMKERKHIIPTQYSAQLARVFNEYAGVQEQHKLKIQERKPKLGHCPACDAYYELLTGGFARPGDPNYATFMERFDSQLANRKDRDTNG